MLPFFLFVLFPYANENRCRRLPVATLGIIVLNVFAFLANAWGHGMGYGDLFGELAYVPGKSEWFALVTYSFAHSNIFHLALNLWFFYLIGGQVEEQMGSCSFVLFYLGGALSGSVGYWLFARLTGDSLGIIGASGAVFAVLGAYFILYPFEEFRFWYFVLFRWGTLKIATLFFVAYKVACDFVLAWVQLKNTEISGIAHWGHLGGLVFGVAVALYAFGAYPFTGKKRLTEEERFQQRLLRRVARRKFYSDAVLSQPMSETELETATDDCSPEEAIRRGIFFHSGRVLEWGYQELLFENPKACLKPAMQLEMIEMMRVHGRGSLADVACWNLLEAHPDSPEATVARFELGRALARLPEMREKAKQLLREFLESEPAERERIEAEQLLRRLDEKPLWQWKP